MSPLCEHCGENMKKMNQQVSVMRKEIKNLRQTLDGAVRAHRKHLMSIQAAVSKADSSGHNKKDCSSSLSAPDALEQGNIRTVPIGYISSCFSVKNGTPRQPTICSPSRAQLRIQQSVFNNPEHSVLGLEQYSHVWIIFLFHKNGHQGYKAKVKPPRLNGQRVGVYSTRSPHRPNSLGLTLAKLDKIQGDTLHLSDIDMIAGTPVLDIKPYIPEYDSLNTRKRLESNPDLQTEEKEVNISSFHQEDKTDDDDEILHLKQKSELGVCLTPPQTQVFPKEAASLLKEVESYVNEADLTPPDCEDKNKVSDCGKTEPAAEIVDRPSYGSDSSTTIADWIREPPVSSLDVRFTPQAQKQLDAFLPAHSSEPSECDRPRFKFLRSPEEAGAAIRAVLSADPRSVYRRTRCRDRLFFFSLDTADVTCWFGQGFAEVLEVRPVRPPGPEDPSQ
ncbi:tRNA (adenine(37)-N6)-methyltransferase [Poeciliopsis prolifica]|uniref:tRNA (adenine(37)-N6)-methyltransferase-like n=1 Tax=Poeciliopsis prolifica TaxID=188132 RepID=UPI00241400D3|nr:tRNA (adenine(37)-N6)-methyltransferase-like [Poeciliopsis prolifica]XP_054875807.1 tRNA (adenine(37)-N6)-methyltransferase [Poeciliopsis prolifica]